jgi:hydroxymethylbilane synthase
MSSDLRILARGSPLSRMQLEEALPLLRRAFPGRAFVAAFVESLGDRDQQTALTDPSIPSDFFTRELDQAQLDGRTDLVVHSAKDLPSPLPDGLVIAALFPARDTRDALILRTGVDLRNGGRVGTSSPGREAEIRKLYPHIVCKPIRGTIGRRLEQLDAGDYDAVIFAGCALQRLGLAARISEWLDYETTPQQGRLAITVRADRHDLIDALRPFDVRQTAGLVALVGCPADARLLGAHARALLDAADIVLHDRLVPDSVLASLGDRAEYIGKKGHSHSTTQAHIHRRILHAAEAGRLVVRLHGGDPGILGRLGETLDFCAAWNLRSEVVPAVSAAQLAAARARCSLTHRDEGRAITFLSGHRGLADHALDKLDPAHGHLALYMGVADIARIRERLLAAGWPEDTPVTSGQFLGSENEELIVSDLRNIHTQALESPAVLLVGPTPHPVSYTLFTGTDPDTFLRHGPLLHFPMIELRPRPLDERVTALRARLPHWDGVIFPSGQAIRIFMDTLLHFADVRALHGKILLAVGPRSAAVLRDYGLRADAAPEGFGGAAALAELSGLSPGRYGYPTSDQSPVDERQAALAEKGIRLDAVLLHDNRRVARSHLPKQPFHRVLFSAGSTVNAYFEAFPDERHAPREWLAVGTSTLRALESLGLPGRIAGG